MAEATIVLEILKCVGSVIPQEFKDKLTRPVSYVFSYGSNIEDIKSKIDDLERVKVEVEVKVRVEETNGKNIKYDVQDWLKGTEEILEKFHAEIKETLGEPESKNCFCGSSCVVGKMLDDIKSLLEKSGDFGSVSYPGDPPPIGSMYLTNNKSLPSREQISNKILKALKNNSTKMITIYGIPGAGKTTLMKEIVGRAEGDKIFQFITEVISVCETPDIKMIQKSIASRIRLNLRDQGNWSGLLHHQLKSKLLEDKRILIVLDDICTKFEDILNVAGIPFSTKDGEPSCTLLLSTRKLDVDKMKDEDNHFRLECLDVAEAKKLFQDRLGIEMPDEEDMSEMYTSLENSVLQKCNGLPSTIIELADELKQIWPNCDGLIYKLRNPNLSEVDGVDRRLHQSIKLSYDLLKNDNKKKFFLLSCLFPSGTNISNEDLMRYGIGLSLFEKILSLDDVTRKAKAWVDDIKALSLFESKDDQACIIHNIIQESAVSIASEEKYLLLLDCAPWNFTETCGKYTIISMNANSSVENNQEDLLELPDLKALFLKGNSSNAYCNFSAVMENLRVLSLTKMKLSTLPTSVKQLKYLQTLSVEYCDIEDASWMSDLWSLQVLSFRGSKIKKFPGDGQLGALKLLDLTGCCFEEVVGDLVAKPSHLEGLYLCGSFVVDSMGEAVTKGLVGRLGSLKHLYGLEIEIPRKCLPDLGHLSLGQKLERFKIAIGCKIPTSCKEYNFFTQIMLFEEIDVRMFIKEPLRNLLEKTEYIRLVKIDNLKKVVYDLGLRFVHLKHLHISHCDQMECIVNTIGMAANSKILPELEILNLEQLEKLEKICYQKIAQIWCPKLRELKLLHLRKLNPHILSIDQASKLAAIEVWDCASLQHIFSTTATSEISEICEFYDIPYLKKLKLQELPMLEGVWAGETAMSDQTYQPLFHYKINLPALEELHLSRLDKITELWKLSLGDDAFAKTTFSRLQILILDEMPLLEKVWDKELCEESLSFRSLKKIVIIKCAHLQSLCPPTIVDALDELESMEITSCVDIKEVIIAESNEEKDIKFSSLRRLKLENLSNLECFYNGSYSAEFPSLKELLLYSLPKMLTFIGPNSNSLTNKMAFIREIKLPSLEHLELCDMEDIEELAEEEHVAFPELKTLIIKNLGLKSIPTKLEKLEQLEVINCSSFEDLPWTSLPNLRSLVIHGCLLGMKPILSLTTIVKGKGPLKLEYINIEECEHLEEFVSEECEHESELLMSGISMFLNLKHIKLHKLPKLRAFSAGQYGTTLPALEKVEISSCPNLNSFTLGELDLDTPSLTFVKVDDACISEENIKLNQFFESITKGLEKGKELEPIARASLEKMERRLNGLKEICVGDCSNIASSSHSSSMCYPSLCKANSSKEMVSLYQM